MDYIKCCDRLNVLIKEDEMFSIMKYEPFSKIPLNKPKIYILCEGGHGGSEDINYCPFCGKEIIFYEWNV